ncbi:hypothetical protein OG418_00325 [Streptomyces phaeochromogenes]|uniref:hypothetical protein n=1 Tax=Streptomyces phaeochromogenes TaxID=1923 RepID=UPI00324BD130
MIVRLAGGQLAGIVLETTDAWVGQWLTVGDADLGYIPVHWDSVTGIVLAEFRAATPRSR